MAYDQTFADALTELDQVRAERDALRAENAALRQAAAEALRQALKLLDATATQTEPGS